MAPTDNHTKSGPEPLTEALIRAAESPAKGKRFLFDGHRDAPKGFGVRIMASGSKTFVLRYLVGGKDRITTIGAVGTWSLQAARKEAATLRQSVDKGTDPVQAERERRAAAEAARSDAERERKARERYTLRALCETYAAHLQAQGKKSAGDARSAFRVHLFDVADFAELAATPAREITPEQIALIVRRPMEAGKVRTAGVLRSYLNAAFTAARRAPYDPKLPAALIPFGVRANPVEVIGTLPVQAGDRALTAPELRAYAAALGDDLPDRALRLALYAGGQRLAQLARARVRDFDPATGTLLLWDGKGRRREPRPHLLPLGPEARALAAALVERAVDRAARTAKRAHGDPDQNPPLFLSRGRPISPDTLSKRVAEIAATLDGQPFDARALRRTCETQMAALGIGKDLRAQLLSHGLSGVQTLHYDRHDYLPEKRAALVAWEAHLQRPADDGTAAVIPFARGAQS